MAITEQSKLDNFTRGSDTHWHQTQMLLAGVCRLLILAAIAAIALFALTVLAFTNSSQREILFDHYKAAFLVKAGIRGTVSLPLADGPRKFTAADAAEITGPGAAQYTQFLLLSLAGSIGAGAIAAAAFMAYLTKRGGEEAKDKFLRGQTIVSPGELARMTRPRSTLGFQIGGVPIPDALLARNFAFIGNPGTGKSRAIFHLLDAARPAMKAVIYDRTGDYVERYYDPARGDVILNPFDLRCAPWSVFADLRSELDYATVAQYFVQDKKGETNPIFTDAARILFEDVIKLVQLEPGLQKTMAEVVRVVTTFDLERLAALLKKHELPSSGAMSAANHKTSESVRFTLISQPAIRFFKYLDGPGPAFSVRDFVESDSKGWLFVLSHPEQHAAIKPFASAWLELAMLASMAGRPVDHTRILFAIDELTSLPVLKALETGLTEARKFGVSIILGLQTVAHVDAIWGSELRRVLLATAQTKAVFRTEEADTAKALSETLGQQEVDETAAGAHFGIESGKDSSQIHRKRSEISLVTPSEIQTLPDRTAYLKIAGSYPLAKVVTPAIAPRKTADAYCKRTLAALTAAPETAGQKAPATASLGIF